MPLGWDEMEEIAGKKRSFGGRSSGGWKLRASGGANIFGDTHFIFESVLAASAASARIAFAP